MLSKEEKVKIMSMVTELEEIPPFVAERARREVIAKPDLNELDLIDAICEWIKEEGKKELG